MQIKTEGLLEIEQWTLRYRLPVGERPHPVLLLIHGWTGDENVMWIFTNRLSPRYLILSPRGLYPAADGGYGWEPRLQRGWPKVENFQHSVDALLAMLDSLKTKDYGRPFKGTQLDFSTMNIMGFSQ